MELVIEEAIYSPRAGCKEWYVFIFNPGNLIVQSSTKDAKCTECSEGFRWMGYNDRNGNPLKEIFDNDCIKCPVKVGEYFEKLYDQYLEERDEDYIKREIQKFVTWLNDINENINAEAVFRDYIQ